MSFKASAPSVGLSHRWIHQLDCGYGRMQEQQLWQDHRDFSVESWYFDSIIHSLRYLKMIVHQLKLLVFCWPTCDNTQSDAHRMQEVLSFMITVDFFVKSPWIASTAQNPKYHSIIALWFNRLPFFWSIGQNSLKDVPCIAWRLHQYDYWWLSCKIGTSCIHNTQFKWSQYNCSMVAVACSFLADKSKYTVDCNRRCSVHALNHGAQK